MSVFVDASAFVARIWRPKADIGRDARTGRPGMPYHQGRSLRTVLLVGAAVLLLSALVCGCGHRHVAQSPFVGYWWLADRQQDSDRDAPMILHVTTTGKTFEVTADGVPSAAPRSTAGRLDFGVLVSDLTTLSAKRELRPVGTVTLAHLRGDRVTVIWRFSGEHVETLAYRRVQAPEGELREGFVAIIHGIGAWATDNGDNYPEPTLVRPARRGETPNTMGAEAVGWYVYSWPKNPFTGKPIHLGHSPGDFDYELVDARGHVVPVVDIGTAIGYRLVGYGADGKPLGGV